VEIREERWLENDGESCWRISASPRLGKLTNMLLGSGKMKSAARN
jgi:hypothetical protein